MARLVEVHDARSCPSPLAVRPGDILLFRAAGGHVRSGLEVVELLGAFVTAVLGDNGQVFTPMGPPNAVMFRALQPGRAVIDVVAGDPFHAPAAMVLAVAVEK